MDVTNASNIGLMEKIMKCEYFDGMDNIGIDSNEFLDECIASKKFDYIGLIFKYFDKNKNLCKQLVSSCKKSDIILLEFLQSDDDIEKIGEWIKYYFDVCVKCQHYFSKSTFNTAVNICRKNKKLSKYQSMIAQKFEF